MAVDSTLLMQEVATVIDQGQGDSNRMFTFQIKAGDTWLTPLRIESVRKIRAYADNQFADIYLLEAKFFAGVYAFDLVKNRDALIAEVTSTELQPGSSAPVADKESVTRRYVAVLATINDNAATNKHSQLNSREALDQAMPPVDALLQLIDECTYKAMMLSGGANYRNMVPMDALFAEYTALFKAMSRKDTERVLDIRITPGFNPTRRTNVIIPHGMHWKDMVFHLHEKEGGLYASGVGRYLQDQILYIYPLYDTVQYRKNSRVLSVINVPNDRYKGGEKTYKVDDQSVTIICTGEAALNDRSFFDKLTNGTGSRFMDANMLLGNLGLVKDGKVLVDKASNLFEVAVDALSEAKSNIQWAAKRVTGNSYLEFSKLASKQGQDLEIEWTHSNIDLLEPGMAVKYQTVDGDTVESYYGVLLGAEELRAPAGDGVINTRFPGKAKLTIRMIRRVNDPNAVPVTTPAP